MDPSEIDAVVQRLVANPHDEEALAYAHQAGAADPKSYAFLLEKVGTETQDPAYASHWLSEAANVWSTTVGDAHRAARVLMMAIDKDPTQQVAAERLSQLYRDKGDVKALVALLDRRTKAMSPMIAQQPELGAELAAMYEELGRLWNEPPLSQPKKAVEAFRRSIEIDPSSAFAIYSLREILKAQGQFDEVFSLYQAELAIEGDPGRRIALLRDEAATRKTSGDLPGVTRALAMARQIDDSDPALQQEYAASVLDRIQSREDVDASERAHAAELLVGLAEVYDGEHGLAYASGALDIEPGHDRALQLMIYYARNLQREDELTPRFASYVQAAPQGAMATEVRHALGASYEAIGDFRAAVQVLEPLGESGDNEAAAKLNDLYPLAASQPPRPMEPIEGSERNERLDEAESAASSSPSQGSNRRVAITPDRMQGLLDAAQMLAGKGKKNDAFTKYREVLDVDPSHPEALAWVEDYLRTKRDYAQLRDVLLASVRAMGSLSEASVGGRKERLREVAGLCEGNLRDIDGAIQAWKQLLALDRADEGARQSLTRLLEKSQRWDDLASLLEQEATAEPDLAIKITLEKKLASLQETKRKDWTAAADAWTRIARMTPEDHQALGTASRLFEKADRIDLAAQVLGELTPGVEDGIARGNLLEKLAELREQLGDLPSAADAYADAADALRSGKLWEAAERCFSAAERWDGAANAAAHRAELASDTKSQAQHFARAADLLMKANDPSAALARLEQATDLDPVDDGYASTLTDRYTASESWEKLVAFLATRGDRLLDRAKRVAVRTQAAQLYATKLGDKEGAREQWLKVLEDGDDREALEKLIDYAVEREDHTEAATLLRRLGNVAVDNADKARVALREAELLAEGVGDIDTAIARYESILSELDATCRPALQAIADLQEARDHLAEAADALERELKLVADPQERGQIAARLARLYEQLDDPRSAIRALDIVRKADLEDFDALARLCELCEKTEQWDRVAELLALRIEVEGDEAESSAMTKKLADILADKLDRGDEALAALTELADLGDPSIRQAYAELGDRLGWKGIVAQKLVEWWFEARQGQERTRALRDAFERFVEVGRDQDASRVAIEIVRSKGGDRSLAERLEDLAVKTGDHDALSFAHDLLARELSGAERAQELVRQAEVRVRAGMPRSESIQHGEAGLTSVAAADAEGLLDRLAALAGKPYEVVDLYERQVSRVRAPADRVRALARAAQVASSKGSLDRARGFFELALSGAATDDTLALLETTARDGDRTTGGEKLRRALCQAMAAGGQGARDGGRSRGALLRRAASMANRDLNDVEQAFTWLGDALVAHVDSLTLDSLEGLGIEVGDPRRSEAVLSHALSEVFDGPLVRQLLARRAKIRAEQMEDKTGAAADLKKLHDLSPNDHAVMAELSALLTELGDYRGMVQLYEDQILRGKDMMARAELARKVARMWEEQLQDPREAADAWRRVLRMKAGDLEAQAGLDRAKTNMLKKPDPGASDAYAPPKWASPVTGSVSAVQPNALTPREESVPPPPLAEARDRNGIGTMNDEEKIILTADETSEHDADAVAAYAPRFDSDPPTENRAAGVGFGARDGSEPEDESVGPETSDDTSPHGVDVKPPLRGRLGGERAAPAQGNSRVEDRLAATAVEGSSAKSARPRDLWFRSSQDEITMSGHLAEGAPENGASGHTNGEEHDRYSDREDDALSALSALDGPPFEDFSATSELSALDELLDATNVARANATAEIVAMRDDQEVFLADDDAEVVEVDDEELELEDSLTATSDDVRPVERKDRAANDRPSESAGKTRSIPPPLPRS